MRILGLILVSLVLAGCGGGGGGDSEPAEVGNSISVFGVDGPMAGADVAIYDLQDYLDDPVTAVNRLRRSETTDALTALADDLELALDAGLGPFMVVITANESTTDLSTGQAPVISQVRTIVTSLTDARAYATPLTSAAIAIASHGESVADNVLENLFGDQATAQEAAKAFFGFGMDASMDIFSIPPILDENTLSRADQEAVAHYRGALESLAAALSSLASSEDTADIDFDALIDDALDNGMLDNADYISAVQATHLDALTSRFADTGITSIAQLLDAELSQLRDYSIDPLVDVIPLNVIDSDLDGVMNVDDAFDFNASETVDSDGDGVGDNADELPNDAEETVDTDGDGVGDNSDNCRTIQNTNQNNLDDDALGDACDDDRDGDNVPNAVDAFPDNANETLDSDGDGVGNNADAFPNNRDETVDTDSDLVGDNTDNCRTTENADQLNLDGDALGDACDPDIDGDGVANALDAFPVDITESADSDQDGVGDKTDAFPNDASETFDTDDDNVGDNSDNCLITENTDQLNLDNDALGDACDPDIDGDGVANALDAFPVDITESADSDQDGVGDNADAFPNDASETVDTDGDNVGDNSDIFPNDPSESLDSDSDGVGDNADRYPNDPNESGDSDGDGIGDNSDAFPNDPNETTDSDSDEVGDNSDAFPNDPGESLDTDGDGVGNNADAFPNDRDETADTDADGVGDNADAFPSDSSETVDSDSDGTGDNSDAFPNDPSESLDSDSDGIGDNADPLPNEPNAVFGKTNFDETSAPFTPEADSGTFGESTWN